MLALTPVEFEFFHKLFEFLIDFLLLTSPVNGQSKISCCFVQCRMMQNSKSTHATILQLSVAKIATDNCNLTLQYIVAPIAAIS